MLTVLALQAAQEEAPTVEINCRSSISLFCSGTCGIKIEADKT
ncbi:MAG: hypothetical protein QNK37_08105 [Acidobacteriota bacterium]|nr:hypothetical protein [Acidobacteriota bacterium]